MMNSTPEYISDIYRNREEAMTNAVKADMLTALMDAHPEDVDYMLECITLLIWYDDKFEECIAYAQKNIPQMANYECIDTMYSIWSSCLEKLGKPEEAVKIKERCLQFNNNDWFTLDDLAKAYEKLGDTENEIKCLALMAEDNGDERQFIKLADLFDEKQDYANSAKYYEMLAHFECDDHAWFISNLGRALSLAGRHDDAVVQLKYCLFLEPDNVNAHYHLADIYETKGDTYRALHHYYEALRIKPDYAYVYVRLGALAYNEEGDIKTAIEHMERALQLNDNEELLKNIYLNLSRLYSKIKDFDKHEFYKAKWAQALGFPDGFVGDLGEEKENEDEDEEEN